MTITTMRAARFHDGLDVRVEVIEKPRVLEPHDVLLRITACGICGTDLHEYRDGPIYAPTTPHPQTHVSLPVILGHEFAGVVEQIGEAVTTVAPGARVAVMPQIYCGECRQCLAGRQQTCERLAAVGYSGPWGGLAEYGVFRESQLSELPEGMTDVEGALVEPTAVAVHAVSSAPVRAGDIVLITGGGPIGQLAALAAVALGAGKVVLSEPHAGRRARAESLGLTRVVDPLTEDVTAAIAELSDGAGADVCLECSGSQPALDACLAGVRLGGTVVQTALGTRPMTINASAALTLRDVTYKGVYCYPVTSWPRIIRLIASGAIPARKVVTSIIALEDVVSGLERLGDPDGDHLKIIVTPTTLSAEVQVR